MKGNFEQLKRALTPLGEPKNKSGQLAYNCPRCEKELNNPKDKHNLEISFQKEVCHCWACGLASGLSYLIEKYGYKEFAYLFKNNSKKYNKEDVKEKTLFLPQYLSTVYNQKGVFDYLKSRGLTSKIIKEREIKYCYDGPYKGNIIFPSYNKEGALTAFVTQNFYTKKYKKHLSSNFICFYENFINKNSLIIMTEGIYDGLVAPNALILLGTEISSKILDFLIDADVLVILDADVNSELIDSKVKQLNSTCKSSQVLHLTEKQNDLNFFYTKKPKHFKRTLKEFYDAEYKTYPSL
jgi:hypothetical protein